MRKVVAQILVICLFLTTIFTNNITVFAAGTAQVTSLRCEYTTEPIGIDVTNPRFSWQMISNERGQKQSAYQIIITKDGGEEVWDSGKINSDQSVGIEYKGSALISQTKYEWTVDVWNKDDVKLASKSSWFETGLLSTSDWDNAQFITASPVVKPNITAYTIETKFKIERDGIGVVFGSKSSSQFLMWQINTFDFAAQQKVYFRPHRWNGAPALLVEKDISSVIPWTSRYDEHTLKIIVDSNNLITTYIDGQQIDQRMDSMASFGDFGFRQCRSVNVAETGYFDDFKVTDNSTGTEKVAFYCDFEKENPLGIGSIQEGRLYVEPIAGEVYTESLIKETSAPMFRKEFTVDSNKTVKSAKLYATALGVYEAYINGQKVGADKLAPGWTDYNDYVLYQTFDITNMLQQDANAIGAVVGDGWYAGHVSTGGGNFNKYGKKTAFLGKLKIEYTDGSSELCVTDATWKNIKTGPFVATDNQDGETYDARKELPGWDSPNFDETAWTNADIASKTNLASTFEPQTIDRVAQIGPAIEVTEELPVLTRTEPTPDTFIYDLGQNVAGWAKIKIQGPAGAKVKIRFGEMLYDGKPITLQYKQEPTSKGSLYTDNLRTAKATDYYILKGDPDGEIYEPRFTYHGFRYIEITCNDPSVIIPGIEDVKGVVVGTNTERVGNYETSDAKVNQLYSNIVWGQRGNFMSVPTDCPQRDERLGWTGDAQVFSRTAMMNMDVNQFFKKYAKDLDYAQLDNGAIFDIAPSQGHAVGAGNAGWGDAAVIIPWNMYTTYGDKQIIRDSYDMMKKWINYCRDTSGKSAGKTYIIANCAYGDWLSMGESTPNDVVATAYFAYSTKLFANMAEVIGNTADASAYNALFENIKNEFNTTFVDADVRIKGNSQTAYLLALSMDLLPQESRAKAGEHLVERIVASNYHLSTGFLGVNILCPVLSEMGYSDLAYELLLTETFPSWLYSVANGATTIWERWNSYTIDGGFGPVGMNSFNHYSYGAVGEWMFNNSAGIDL
ncbi:MAG: alfa-L-rhamnosidase, partial [Clostridia bacterium]|nr:alfa-L-rhamnosidase [Clostridia bacterium]